jgi:hypothetical protein
VVIDALLELGDDRVRVAVGLARAASQLADEVLHARVLADRLVDLALQLGIARPPERRIEDLLLDPRVDVELAADALERGRLLPRGDVADDALYQARETASPVVLGEEPSTLS